MAIGDLIDQFRPRRKVRLGTRCTYMLSQLGKGKVEEFGLSGPQWDVLAYLDENGQCTIKEISDGTHHSDDKVKQILKKLIGAGYVKRVATED